MITIAGGKLTTYRVMARDVVDRVATRLHELDGRPTARRAPTDRLPLPVAKPASWRCSWKPRGRVARPTPRLDISSPITAVRRRRC